MTCRRSRSNPSFIVLFVIGGLPGAAALASDLTIAPTTRELHQRNEQHSARTVAAARKVMHAKTAKARRAEKDRQHRIITYNLFHDPFLKTGAAVSDKRHPGAGDLRGLTATAFPAIAANSPGLPSRIPSSAAAPLKLAPMEEEGFAFDCKEKPSAAVPARRGLTACFKQRLDNSWKTQTYVSGTRSDGNVSWGGGLSLGYDY